MGAERFHFLDVARATLMVLGIPFHAALVFANSGWIVDWPEHNPWLGYLSEVISMFRMPAFFLIAGFFAALLLERRSPLEWLRQRTIRLGVPLLTGLVVIVPIQDAILWMGPAKLMHVPHTLGGGVLSHLWFLPVLLMLCALLAASWNQVARVTPPDLPAWLFGLLAGLWTILVYALPSRTGINLAPFERLVEFDSVLEYAPYFLLGVAMHRNPAVFLRMRTWHWPTALAGVSATVCTIFIEPKAGGLELTLWCITGSIGAVCLSQTLLAALARLADRSIPAVEKLVDASFSIYLFHHPVIIVWCLALAGTSLFPLALWIIICIATLAITYAMHALLRRSRLLLFLFNGISMARVLPTLIASKPAL